MIISVLYTIFNPIYKIFYLLKYIHPFYANITIVFKVFKYLKNLNLDPMYPYIVYIHIYIYNFNKNDNILNFWHVSDLI